MGTGPRSGSESDEPSVEMMLEVLSSPALVVGAQTGTIQQTNPAAEQLLGSEYDSLPETDLSVLFPDADKITVEGGPFQTIAKSLDGEYQQVDISVRAVEHRNQPCQLVVLEEIGAREKEYWEQQYVSAQFQSLLGAMATPVIGVDAIGNIEVWNAAAEQTFGWNRSELLGQPIFPLFDVEEGRITRLYDQLAEGEPVVGQRVGIQSKNGEYIETELYTHPLYVDEEFAGAIGTAVDTRERSCLRQQLHSLHRVLRHNLRTRLNIIEGSAEMLLEDNLPAEQKETYADQIFEAADQLLRVSEEANRIRQLAGNGATGTTELTTVLEDIEAFLNNNYPQLPVIIVDNDTKAEVSECTEQILTGVLVYLFENESTADTGIHVQTESDSRSVQLRVTFDKPMRSLPDARSILNGETDEQLRHEEGLALSRVQILSTAIGGKVSLPNSQEVCCRVPRRDL